VKITIEDNSEIYIYLNKYLTLNCDFNNKEEIEKYLKTLFKKLNNYYQITISGYYIINMYIDKFYGTVLKIKKEDIGYYDYCDNHVDMRIIYHYVDFLYLIEDLEQFTYNKLDIYVNKDNIYLKINKELTEKEMGILIENSNIIFDNSDNIIRKSFLIDKKVLS